MTSPNKSRFKLSEIVTQIEADNPSIEIELNDGQVISIPPSKLWPDLAMQELTEGKFASAGRAILGDEKYERFVAGGGSTMILADLIERTQGASVGESNASPSS